MPVVGRITGLVSLSLDGVACGFVRSVSGGDISAPVIEETLDPAGFVQKRLGTPVYEDIALQVGLGMGPALYEWIAATWARNFERKDGAIAATDVNLQVRSNREFSRARIGAVTFPALDVAAKDTAFLTVTLTPVSVMTATASGSLVAPQAEKKWLPANFRLELDGIDCSRVSRIDSFTVTVETSAAQVGGLPAPHVEPSTIDFPNLSVTVAEAGAQSWIDWFDDFVVNGNNDASKERGGAIVFLAPDMTTEFGRVTLHNAGIFALRRPAQGTGSEQLPRLTAGLYCEHMNLQIGTRAPAVTPEPVMVVPAPPSGPTGSPVRREA